MPGYLLDALVEATEVKLPEYVLPLLASATNGLQSFAFGGLFLLVITYKGLKIFGKYKEHVNSPYRFLARIHSAGATLRTQPT